MEIHAPCDYEEMDHCYAFYIDLWILFNQAVEVEHANYGSYEDCGYDWLVYDYYDDIFFAFGVPIAKILIHYSIITNDKSLRFYVLTSIAKS